jgi:hypothetical protein
VQLQAPEANEGQASRASELRPRSPRKSHAQRLQEQRALARARTQAEPGVDELAANPSEGNEAQRRDWGMICVRYVLPALVVLAGVIVMAFGGETDLEGGAGIVSAGLAIYAINWLFRLSVDGDRVREQEEAARRHLDLHGRWPDE